MWWHRNSYWQIRELKRPCARVERLGVAPYTGNIAVLVSNEYEVLLQALRGRDVEGTAVIWEQHVYDSRTGELIRTELADCVWAIQNDRVLRMFHWGPTRVVKYWLERETAGDPRSRFVVRDMPSGKELRSIVGTTMDSPVADQYSFTGDDIRFEIGQHNMTLWRRRPWWGVFWLWEFWLTAFFGALFAWSVVRDRRTLGGPG